MFQHASTFRAEFTAYASQAQLAYDADAGCLRMVQHHAIAHEPPRTSLFGRGAKDRSSIYEETATLLISFLVDRLRPAVFFDIGAAYGHFALVALSHRQHPPVVHAFEMRPDRYEHLQGALSRDARPNGAVAHLAALSDHHKGMTDIWFSRHRLFEREPTRREAEGPWWIRLRNFLRGDRRRALTKGRVLTTTIDHFCDDTDLKPDLIKIDVDGYEGKVLRGGVETLERHKPLVLLELHKDKLLERNGDRRSDVVATLFDLGYRAYFFTDHESLADCQIVEVKRGDGLLLRQETDQLLFFPRR